MIPGLVSNESRIVGGEDGVGKAGEVTGERLEPTSLETGARSSEVVEAFTAGVTGT